jgi:catechol 2,3-dioxygenase-like lactoylglutathione lyase family enzyme
MGAGTISEMKNLECITLFVEDLAASKKFYLEIFDLKIVYEGPVSAVFKLENVMINLLKICAGPDRAGQGRGQQRGAAAHVHRAGAERRRGLRQAQDPGRSALEWPPGQALGTPHRCLCGSRRPCLGACARDLKWRGCDRKLAGVSPALAKDRQTRAELIR